MTRIPLNAKARARCGCLFRVKGLFDSKDIYIVERLDDLRCVYNLGWSDHLRSATYAAHYGLYVEWYIIEADQLQYDPILDALGC